MGLKTSGLSLAVGQLPRRVSRRASPAGGPCKTAAAHPGPLLSATVSTVAGRRYGAQQPYEALNV